MTQPQLRLYDHRIDPANRMTLCEQIYCILCEEIHSGRWSIGERLPGVAALAVLSGVSRAPIQQAFDRLEEEGCLRREARSGTYLKALLPHGATSLGAIGIALPSRDSQARDATLDIRLHAILQGASERRYTTEVVYLSEDADWSNINVRGARFSADVRGIIALRAFPYLFDRELPPDRTPMVVWGGADDHNRCDCAPLVTHDTRCAFYLLTRRLIEAGHRRILMLGHRREVRPPVRAERIAGHEAAMREADLEVLREGLERSLQIDAEDIWGLGELLDAYAGDITAVICMWRGVHSVHNWAMRRGLRVPQDLSIAGHTPEVAHNGLDASMTFTCIDYAVDRTVRTCFRILTDLARRHQCDTSVIRIRPFIIDGDSIGPACDAALAARYADTCLT